VREALTNVIKHAQASVAWLRLEALADGGLVLAVVDNGLKQRVGDAEPLPLFVPASLMHRGRGVANMERRARALAAHLDSGPHAEGWAVTLVLPAQALAAARVPVRPAAG
jgi:signal transduction histidine kinase